IGRPISFRPTPCARDPHRQFFTFRPKFCRRFSYTACPKRSICRLHQSWHPSC
ncbi:hypothetical protein BDR07DRAFT_1402960, partial [Suillus spraguei]